MIVNCPYWVSANDLKMLMCRNLLHYYHYDIEIKYVDWPCVDRHRCHDNRRLQHLATCCQMLTLLPTSWHCCCWIQQNCFCWLGCWNKKVQPLMSGSISTSWKRNPMDTVNHKQALIYETICRRINATVATVEKEAQQWRGTSLAADISSPVTTDKYPVQIHISVKTGNS